MFRSLTIYQATQATAAILGRLEDALRDRPFQPCGETFLESHGWVPPLGGDTEDVCYGANGGVLFCLRTDEKTVPPAAVRIRVDEKAKKIEEAEGEAVTPGRRRVLKEEVVQEYTPRAIPAPRRTYAYFDKELAMLLVGATEAESDHFMNALRDTQPWKGSMTSL